MLSLENITLPVSLATPAGRDIGASGELLELETMAKPVLPTNAEGKRITDDFSEHEPDWAKLEARCKDLLTITRDLRVAAFYAAALLRGHGFSGLARGLEIIREMMQAPDYRAYPQCAAGDRDALLERWYTLAALGAPYKHEGDLLRMIEGVRGVTLARSQPGPWRYLDVIAAQDRVGGADAAGLDRLRAGWKKSPADERTEITAALAAALDALEDVETALLEQTPEDLVPPGANAKPLQGLAHELREVAAFLHEPAARPKAASASASAPAEEAAAVPGEIRSRVDAIRILQQVSAFFRKTEPASPIPFLVDRAVRLVDRDFLGLLGELVPDAVPKFQSAAGLEPKAPASS